MRLTLCRGCGGWECRRSGSVGSYVLDLEFAFDELDWSEDVGRTCARNPSGNYETRKGEVAGCIEEELRRFEEVLSSIIG